MDELPDRKYVRPEQVAEYFDVDVRTVRRWCYEEPRKLEYCKPNGVLRIVRDSVILLEKKTKNIPIESEQEVEAKIKAASHKGRRIISKGI